MREVNVKNIITSYFEFAKTTRNEYSENLLLSLIASYEKNVLQDIKPQQIWKFWFRAFLSYYRVDFICQTSKKYQILLWPVQLNHLDFLIPVYHELSSSTDAAFICYRKDLVKILKEQNLPLIEVKLQNRILPSISGLIRGIALLKIIGRAMFTKHFSPSHIPYLIATVQQFSYYETYSRLFYKVQFKLDPKYHLLGYEHSVLCRPINILSNKYGILTGNIQHGALNENLIPHSICKHQFVWDNFAKRLYKNNQQNIFTTGSPNVNHLDTENKLTTDLEEIFKINPVILVCYSGPGHNITVEGHHKNITSLLTMVQKLRDFHFVIKLHNKDKINYYNSFQGEYNVTIIDQNSELFGVPIVNYIQKSILIITGASTVSIEAAQQGKPVICMDLNRELQHIEFIKSDFFYHCESEIDFENSLLSIIKMDSNFLEKQKALLHLKNNNEQLKNDNPAQKISSIITQSIKQCAE
jgi:hypothetical protein